MRFERKTYKAIAKKQLHGRWLSPLLATITILVIAIIFWAPQIKALKISQSLAFPTVANIAQGAQNLTLDDETEELVQTLLSQGTGNGFLPVISILVMGIISIAYSYLFIVLSHTTEPQPYATFIRGFSLWVQGVLGLLWTCLWTTVWSCIFVIPGIVKGLAYSMTLFILAEHPSVGVRKALKLSIAITKGHKFDLFILQLSWLGWYALCAVTGGLAGLYVWPYQMMTETNAYHALKADAIATGRLSEADFGIAATPEPIQTEGTEQ